MIYAVQLSFDIRTNKCSTRCLRCRSKIMMNVRQPGIARLNFANLPNEGVRSGASGRSSSIAMNRWCPQGAIENFDSLPPMCRDSVEKRIAL